MKSLTVPARADQLDAVLDFVARELESNECPPKTQARLAVAAEEVFINIARYAYAPGSGEVTIEIGIEPGPRAAVLRFLDRGAPFNPLEKPDPDVTLPAEDREIGGLGIFMVKRSVDGVRYAREGDRNVLTLTKALA